MVDRARSESARRGRKSEQHGHAKNGGMELKTGEQAGQGHRDSRIRSDPLARSQITLVCFYTIPAWDVGMPPLAVRSYLGF